MNQISTVLNELKDDVVAEITENSAKKDVPKAEDKTQNKVYVQRKEYFLETTPDKLMTFPENDYHYSFSWNHLPLKQLEAIDIAILFQNKSHIVSNLCYGLLGGISLMQLVLTHTLANGSKHQILSFIELYSKFGYIPSVSFSILTTICLVFAFDKLDVITIKKLIKHEERTFFSNWALLFLYTFTFILSVLCFRFDETIAQYHENENTVLVLEDFLLWKALNFWRCIFGIVGWFFVCITRPYDLLEHHLLSLKNSKKEKKQKAEH